MCRTIVAFFIILSACALTAESCYAAPGFFTGWCPANRAIVGHPSMRVAYCFEIKGDMNINCEVLASNYEGKGVGIWGNYNVGVITDGDCVRMFWGRNAAVPSVRCWSYGTGVHFNYHTE